MTVTLPAIVSPGTGYRVRIVSSAPVISSNDNGSNITILGPSISLAPFSGSFMPGATFKIDYTRSGVFLDGNTMQVQLSDASGSFSSPTILPGLDKYTYMTVTLPATVSGGSGYRVRIVSSAPVITSNDNGSDITILGPGLSVKPFTITIRQGGTFKIYYTRTGVFGAGNVMRAQLSDASGSFASPTVLFGLDKGTYMTVTLPNNVTPGTGYRVRIVSSSPVITSNDNGSNITIFANMVTAKVAQNSIAAEIAPEDALMLTAYPNPVKISDKLTLQLSAPLQKAATLYVYDLLGREVKQQAMLAGEDNATLEVSNLSKGVYQIILLNTDAKLQTKFLVE